MKLYVFFCIVTTFASWLLADAYGGVEEVDKEIVNTNDDLVIQLLRRMEHLESRDRTQQYEIETLRVELEKQKQRTISLEEMIRRLKRNTEPEKSESVEVKEMEEEKDEEKRTANVNRSVSSETIPSTGHGTKERIRREGETNVGFLSTLAAHLNHMGVNQNIVFDNVVTNVGNAYNQHTGGFQAPVSGMYVFSVTLLSQSSDSHFVINLNGNVVAAIHAAYGHSASSQTVVLVLKQGDDVTVRNKDSDESLYGDHYSSFAGFLVQQDYTNTGSIVGK